MRLTGDLMSANLGTIVSMTLWSVRHPLYGVAQNLPKCRHLTALYIRNMSNKEDRDLLVSVIPVLTQLTTVWYHGGDSVPSDAADHRAVVAAIMSLTQLEWIRLGLVRLGDDGVEGTDAMTRLRTVVLGCVYITAGAWDRFVTSLLTLPQSLSVVLRDTDIDEGTVRRIQTSQRVTVTRDDGERDEDGDYERLEFTTVPSQTDK